MGRGERGRALQRNLRRVRPHGRRARVRHTPGGAIQTRARLRPPPAARPAQGGPGADLHSGPALLPMHEGGAGPAAVYGAPAPPAPRALPPRRANWCDGWSRLSAPSAFTSAL